MDTTNELEPDPDAGAILRPGSRVYIHSFQHRLLAIMDGRMLLTDVRTHHPWLVQDDDGSLQLPSSDRVLDMLTAMSSSESEIDP